MWKPIFTRHPQNNPVHFYDGAAMVTLECAVDGFPRPVISWLENNSTVINETVNQNGSVSSLALVFQKISEQALTYRCVARNSVGTTLSKEVTLTFPESPSSITSTSTPAQSHGQGRLKERHTLEFLSFTFYFLTDESIGKLSMYLFLHLFVFYSFLFYSILFIFFRMTKENFKKNLADAFISVVKNFIFTTRAFV